MDIKKFLRNVRTFLRNKMVAGKALIAKIHFASKENSVTDGGGKWLVKKYSNIIYEYLALTICIFISIVSLISIFSSLNPKGELAPLTKSEKIFFCTVIVLILFFLIGSVKEGKVFKTLQKWLTERLGKIYDVLKFSGVIVAGLVFAHVFLWFLFNDFYMNWWGDGKWFWLSNFGFLIIPTFFALKNDQGKASIAGGVSATVLTLILSAYFYFDKIEPYRQAVEVTTQQAQIKNVVMGLPTSPMNVEIPAAPKKLIVNPGEAKILLCYNNNLPMKIFHVNQNGKVVTLFENVKGQDVRAENREFPVLPSGGHWEFQAQGEQSFFAKMWAVSRGESCN